MRTFLLLFNDYSSKAFKAWLTVKKKFQESDSSRRIGFLFTEQSYFATHIYSRETARPVTTVPISPVRPVILQRSHEEDRGKTVVEVKIQWPCNKNKVITAQRDHNHNVCEIQNPNSGILEHD